MAIIIIKSPPRSSNDFSKERFNERYDLTNTELLLTEAIFNDVSLKEYAASRKIKISTARWTLDNIFEKQIRTHKKNLNHSLYYSPVSLLTFA